jgi:uncharacterized protein
MNAEAEDTFSHMLRMLSTPAAFPDAPMQAGELAVIQTHASAVILTPDRVYKLKKPRNFGFFDYSTAELRRHFCILEVRLNASLAPGIYLGVTPIISTTNDHWRFGPPLTREEVPTPGQIMLGGIVSDYAVTMVRLPDEATLEARVRSGTANPELLADIAGVLATFHRTTSTSQDITAFGQLDVIRENWEENFRQMAPYIGRTLDERCYEQIAHYVHSFLDQRTALFLSRMRDGRIRDCHGDVRLQHVYCLEDYHADIAPHVILLDRIEFNERFRYSDVAAEVAFLAMELDAASRADLASAFVAAYRDETNDASLYEVLPFYKCYRACVRAKVTSFQLDEAEVAATQRKEAQEAASSLFTLAASYAQSPTQPVVIMLGGVMGTGKSTLARALQRELGWELISSDALRKHLARLDPRHPQADAFNQGLYSPQWTIRTYHALNERVMALLRDRRSMILDASFIRRADRRVVADSALAAGASAIFIECSCPREVALQRLALRWHIREERQQFTPLLPTHDAASASDGRPELYDAQQAQQEAFVAQEEPGITHLEVSTVQLLSACVAQIAGILGLPQPTCHLYTLEGANGLDQG